MNQLLKSQWLSFAFFLLFVGFACTTPPTQEDCANSLECERMGRCTLKGIACIATSEKDCRASRFCADLGLCSLDNERCVAKLENDCRNSTACQKSRQCIPSGGECVELTTSYCRITSPTCRKEGACALDRQNNVCYATQDKDCKASDICQSEGKCSVDTNTGKCVVKSDGDCRLHVCQSKGQCYLTGLGLNRRCVPKAARDCLNSDTCKLDKQEETLCAFDSVQQACVKPKEYCASNQNPLCAQAGKCTWSTRARACIAANDDDCKTSTACIRSNKCKASQGICISPADDFCGQSALCKIYGACAAVSSTDKTCVIKSQVHCEQSYNCLTLGRCKLRKGSCVVENCQRACAVSGHCKQTTHPTDNTASCIAEKDTDCQKSEFCKRYGLCKYDASQRTCVVGTDCKFSCSETGHCQKKTLSLVSTLPIITLCLATNDADCKKSKACKTHNMCSFNSTTQRCEAISCETSNDACRENGNCSETSILGQKYCTLLTNEDCQKSKLCKDFGQCLLENGRCVAARSVSTCKDKYCNRYCEKTTACTERGRCTLDIKNNRCVPSSSANCLQSNHCKTLGLCVFDKDKGTCSKTTCDKEPCKEHGHCTTREGRCIPSTVKHCADSNLCKIKGLCSLGQQECVTLTNLECDNSTNCKNFGQCIAKNGACVATNCQKARSCTIKGFCQLDTKTGTCVPGTDKNCRDSIECNQFGWCKKFGNLCILDKSYTKNCSLTPCNQYGHCTQGLYKGRNACIPTKTEDCQKSYYCREVGNCRLVDGACIPSSTNCPKSNICKTLGLCKQKGILCVPDHVTNSCTQSITCRANGRCLAKEGVNFCTYLSGACGLQPCHEFGHCKVAGSGNTQKCNAGLPASDPKKDTSKNCQDSNNCYLYGHCFLSNLSCAAGSPAQPATCPVNAADCKAPNCIRKKGCTGRKCCYLECSKHTACLNSGGCDFAKKHVQGNRLVLGCYPTKAQDCRGSNFCRLRGLCSFHKGHSRCVADNDVDCRNSSDCTFRGECKANSRDATGKPASNSIFVGPLTCFVDNASNCTTTTVCTSYGLCDFKNNTCQASTDSSCKSKSICTQFGRCTARNLSVQGLNTDKIKKEKDPQLSVYLRDLLSKAANGSVGFCVATKQQDCEASKNCKDSNKKHCGVDSSTFRCVTCDKSTDCSLYGKCTYDATTGTCVVGSEADCKQSRECTALGKCSFNSTSKTCL